MGKKEQPIRTRVILNLVSLLPEEEDCELDELCAIVVDDDTVVLAVVDEVVESVVLESKFN